MGLAVALNSALEQNNDLMAGAGVMRAEIEIASTRDRERWQLLSQQLRTLADNLAAQE